MLASSAFNYSTGPAPCGTPYLLFSRLTKKSPWGPDCHVKIISHMASNILFSRYFNGKLESSTGMCQKHFAVKIVRETHQFWPDSSFRRNLSNSKKDLMISMRLKSLFRQQKRRITQAKKGAKEDPGRISYGKAAIKILTEPFSLNCVKL